MVIRREKLLNWAALLTIVALLIQMLPSTAWAAGLTFDNDDGTYTYEVNSDDTITITNFEPDPGITEIEIPDEIDSKAVTYIGKDAFAENQLTEVTLSTGVKVIGERAFFSNQLTKVTIPASVTSIEEFAFADNQLTEVAIPTGVKGISLYAFAWNQLTKATIPASVTSIGEGAFIDNQLTEVILSAGVASIGDRAFSGNQLTVVTIPSSVTSIGFDAFANNQTNAADLIIYGNKGSAAETYANNKNHTFRAAEYTVTYIGNGSTGGTVPTDNNIYAEGQAVTVIDNTGNLVKSGYTFVGWNTQADGKGTSYAVGATFTMGDSDVTLYAMWTADTFNNADGTYTYEVNSDDTITITSFDPNNAVTEIEIPAVIEGKAVTTIGGGAFISNRLTEVAIPASVTNIGDDVFADNQTNAADLIIYGHKGSAAETYANNNYHTFRAAQYTVTYNGNGSTGGTVPTDNNIYAEGQAVTVIDNTGNLVKSGYTFVGWNTQADGKGTSYAVGATFTMGDSDVTLYAMWTADTFNNADGTYTYEVNSDDTITITSFDPNNAVTEIEIPAVIEGKAVTHIGDYAFRGNELTEVAFPASVTSIGEGAFVNNQLTEVAIPTGVTSISNYAFATNQLTEVTIPTGVTSIGGFAFAWNQLTHVIIPTGVTSIGNYAFSENQLTKVAIPTGVTSISDYAFAGNQLGEVIIPANVTHIGEGAFVGNQLTEVAIPTGVTRIGDRAFAGNELREVTIPVSVTSIGDEAFANNQTNAADLIIYGYKGSAAETYANNNNHTFRAIYTVTYNGNGSTGGTVPTDNNIYADGQTVTVIDNTGNLVKSGFTFAGWNTQADGKGMSYAAGATFTMADSDVTLYAKWTAISSGGSGGSGGSYIPTPPNNETKPKDGNVTLPAGVAGTGNLNDTIIIDIPAGATKQELRLTIQKVGDTQKLLTDEDVLVSDIYEVLKNFPENFDKAVKLSIVFDPSKLASDQTTAVFYYDEAKQEWIKIEGGVVVGDRITVEVDHLNKFAVFAVDKQNEVSPSFSDITGHWAEANIRALVNTGIISGYPNGTFLPNHHITRAEFVTMLVKAFGLEAGEGKVFADTADHWAKDAIAIAEASGIVSGYNETTFGADDSITREQMAVMIARAMNLQASRAAMDFIDSADISSWAADAIAAAFQAGIITGFPDHSFKPQRNTSRAEAATVLYQALNH